MNQINIERLHDVLEGKLRGRAVGQTYSQLVRIAGMVDLCAGKRLCFISATHNSREHDINLFRQILAHMDMDADVERYTRDVIYFKNGTTVHFISATTKQFYNGLLGLRLENIEIDHAVQYLDQDDYMFLNSRLV